LVAARKRFEREPARHDWLEFAQVPALGAGDRDPGNEAKAVSIRHRDAAEDAFL
jgi:hypothetical protein